jgi:hypothetical protein
MCHNLRNGYGFISLILLQLTAFTATLGADQSPWSSSSSPGWGDFQGTPPALSSDPSEHYDAYVYTEIPWDFTWDVSTRTLEVNVQAVFDHSVSWYRPSEATPALLVHEVAKPIPGYYEGSLSYTLQAGSHTTALSVWEWTLQGQWHFAFTADELGGDADWSHWITNNLYGGHLVNVTTPNVPSYPAVDVSIEADTSGEHFWMDFSGAAPSSIPSHELMFAPVFVPGGPAVFPGNTTINFSNGAAIALGHWMKKQGTSSLKMKAPITCPNETIQYEFPVDDYQILVMDWVLTRISDSPGGSGAGGSGSGGIGTGSLPVSEITFDSITGVLSLHWDASAAGELFVIEASADLEDWTEVGEITSASPGVVTFQFDASVSTTSSQFFRILPGVN